MKELHWILEQNGLRLSMWQIDKIKTEDHIFNPRCPYCREKARRDAIICPHCRTLLGGTELWRQAKSEQLTEALTSIAFSIIAILLGAVMLVALLPVLAMIAFLLILL